VINSPKAGFVGIVSILIVTVLIGVWLYYFSPLAGTKPTIEQERSVGVEAIQKAENAKILIETKDYGL
jgi:hypothetical protein